MPAALLAPVYKWHACLLLMPNCDLSHLLTPITHIHRTRHYIGAQFQHAVANQQCSQTGSQPAPVLAGYLASCSLKRSW